MSGSSRLWTIAPTARLWLGGAILAGIGASLAWAAILIGLALVVAAVFEQGATSAGALPLIVALLLIVVVRALLLVVAEGSAQHAASLVKAAERRRVVAILRSRHPVVALGARSGELVHLVSGDIERLDGFVGRYLPARVHAVTVPLLLAGLIGVIDPLTLPILLFTGPLLVITLALIGRTTDARTRRREQELTWLDGHFLDMVRGLPTLRLFGRSREQADTIDAVARRLASSSLDVLRTAFQTSLVLEWGATAATALVAILVSVRLMAGDLAFDRALAVLFLTPECFLPVRRLATHYHVGAAGRVALATLTQTADAGAPARDLDITAAESTTIDAGMRAPTIEVRSLTVAYPDREDAALDDVSFEIGAHRLTVIDGATGAGKSTLVAVMLRFLDPTDGRILADGVDISTVDTAAWRRRIAWLPQEPHLFDGTVGANLRLGVPNAPDEAIRAAARAAGVDGVIEALPEGYDTRLGEDGSRLSGGEVARIALARALLREPALLIVDEPTAHLDAVAAAAVRATLLATRRTSTVLVISHDPGLAVLADRRITLQAGKVHHPDQANRDPVAGRGRADVAWLPRAGGRRPSPRSPTTDHR